MKQHFLLYACIVLVHSSAFAQEWVRQHPFAGFAPLHAITFDDNGNGWAVGQQSLILHTADWGNIWNVQSGLPIGFTFEAVEIVPGTDAQIVLAGGPGLFRTTNGGSNWSFIPLGQSLDAINRIQAFDAQHWVATGWSKGVRTTDGGQTWTFFDMPGNGTSAAYFTDPDNGWAGSGPFNSYQLYRTTNGGMTWDLTDATMHPVITDIHMINTQVGFMSARDFMYKTTNGGTSWTKLHQDVQPSLNGMHVVNENIIYSSLNNGFVFFTVNGGTNWTQVNPNILGSNQTFDLYARADGRIWLPGKFASILYSDDQAQSWRDQTPGTKNTLYDIAFLDEKGIAAGAGGLILRTTNGGAIWEDITLNTQGLYYAQATLESGGQQYFYLGASNGEVFRTTNHGDSWEMAGQLAGEIRALYALTPQVLLAGTTGAVLRSTNGGQTWTPLFQTANYVSAFAFPDAQTGYVTVQDGRVMKSTNGGETWNPVLERDNSYRFTGVHFHDALTGWAVAEFKDSVFTTTNGGASWTPYKLPTNTFWQDVGFMNADTGYICGGSSGYGVILRTEDGGQTWEYDFFETEFLSKLYIHQGEQTLWVAGVGGNILHYTPCAAPSISNLAGDADPCEDAITVYEVVSDGATLFTWTVPVGWTIVGNDNSARVEVLPGPGGGTISVRGANSCGAVTATLMLQVSSLPVGNVKITEEAGVLSTTLMGVTYQWLKDDVEIDGATNPQYTPLVSGAYKLVVTFGNGCTATSETIHVIISSTRDALVKPLTIYPNPAQDIVQLELPVESGTYALQLFDIRGTLLHESPRHRGALQISDLPAGVYFVRITDGLEVWTGKFMRSR